MAYLYRGTQSSRDEQQTSNGSNNAFSTQRNPNRLSGGVVRNTESRVGLARRFTLNELPTLSPIGQQRRQAAGEGQMSIGVGDTVDGSEILAGLEAGSSDGFGGRSGEGVTHKRSDSSCGAVGDGKDTARGKPTNKAAGAGGGQEQEGIRGLSPTYILFTPLLTSDGKPTGKYVRSTPSERRILQLESLLEQQRRISAELNQFDDDTRREVEEGLRHERLVSDMMAQSEPTTPPEYQDGLNGTVTRPNRYSTTSLTSPPTIANRTNRSSIHLTSPSAGVIRPYTATANSTIPSQSVPGSRRHSDDEEEDDFLFYDTSVHRAAANPNRNSLPVTSYDRKRNAADLSSALGPLNTTSFLFDDDEEKPSAPLTKSSNKTSPQDIKTYLQVQHTADGFPKLIRREENGEPVSGSSAALDLALAQPSSFEQQVTGRATASRHRISLPPSALSSNGNIAPLNSILANADTKFAANNRRSLEVKFAAETKRPALMASPPHGMSNGAQKAISSYSTNDIPTLKSINNENSGGVPVNSPSVQPSNLADSTSPEQRSGSISRVTTGTSSVNAARQSQDFSVTNKAYDNNSDVFGLSQSGLQANAAPFGPNRPQEPSPMPSFQQPSNMTPYGQPAFYGGYGMNGGMQMLNNGMGNMNLSGGYGAQGQYPNQMPQYQQGGYGGYQQYPQGNQAVAGAGRFQGNQRDSMQRKQQADELFNSVTIPDLLGQIYGLCKDQHGCRFLQKKLEERSDQDVQIIFDEVKTHFHELMTDPFGNYLCQRLLEYTNDEQRTFLVENAMSEMAQIALNQHGTRALQKMIESISTEEQTQLVIQALRYDVVQLIQDLNGNHVIQKCLNHLSPHDAQFIFDAVGANCVTVGTHRHGCCVLQRCVDHAANLQKGALVDQIIANAFSLVQDPFGNYVVQYILDLSEPCFTEPLCRSFAGNIGFLSKQKFSSNVIEKCIRCAGAETKRILISEIAPPFELEKLLRDSFANYVVQTAIDFADEETKAVLIENLRPILPNIRHTPYGRRITSKILDYDTGLVGLPASHLQQLGHLPPPSSMGPGGPPFQATGRNNRMGMVGAPPQWANNNGFGAPNGGGVYGGGAEITSPVPQRNQAYNLLNGGQSYQNNGFNMGPGPPSFGHF